VAPDETVGVWVSDEALKKKLRYYKEHNVEKQRVPA
jgi:hypothetical protein